MALHPPWLKPLLEKEPMDYECETHWIPDMFFCHECMTPLCPRCHDNKHKEHDAIGIFRVSRNSAVRIEDIENLLDGFGIPKFSFNKYIRPSTGHRRSFPYCVQCKCQLLSTESKFCSIGCKVDSQESTLVSPPQQSIVQADVPPTDDATNYRNPHTLRNRPRKQNHPNRAPFI